MPPLTFHEYIELKELRNLVIQKNIKTDFRHYSKVEYEIADIEAFNGHFIDYINFGGYPEVVFSEQIQSEPGRYIRNDIIDKVLLRDLPILYGIQDIQELNSLFSPIKKNDNAIGKMVETAIYSQWQHIDNFHFIMQGGEMAKLILFMLIKNKNLFGSLKLNGQIGLQKIQEN